MTQIDAEHYKGKEGIMMYKDELALKAQVCVDRKLSQRQRTLLDDALKLIRDLSIMLQDAHTLLDEQSVMLNSAHSVIEEQCVKLRNTLQQSSERRNPNGNNC